MMGRRPTTSLSFANTGTEAACASVYTEKSHGNCSKPPNSSTIVGTAVASTVASIAMRKVESMRARRMGPRSDRNPTPSTTRCPFGVAQHGIGGRAFVADAHARRDPSLIPQRRQCGNGPPAELPRVDRVDVDLRTALEAGGVRDPPLQHDPPRHRPRGAGRPVVP